MYNLLGKIWHEKLPHIERLRTSTTFDEGRITGTQMDTFFR